MASTAYFWLQSTIFWASACINTERLVRDTNTFSIDALIFGARTTPYLNHSVDDEQRINRCFACVLLPESTAERINAHPALRTLAPGRCEGQLCEQIFRLRLFFTHTARGGGFAGHRGKHPFVLLLLTCASQMNIKEAQIRRTLNSFTLSISLRDLGGRLIRILLFAV